MFVRVCKYHSISAAASMNYMNLVARRSFQLLRLSTGLPPTVQPEVREIECLDCSLATPSCRCRVYTCCTNCSLLSLSFLLSLFYFPPLYFVLLALTSTRVPSVLAFLPISIFFSRFDKINFIPLCDIFFSTVLF